MDIDINGELEEAQAHNSRHAHPSASVGFLCAAIHGVLQRVEKIEDEIQFSPKGREEDWTAVDSRRNDSPKFHEIVGVVQEILAGSSLARGLDEIAEQIVGTLAHTYHLAPKE